MSLPSALRYFKIPGRMAQVNAIKVGSLATIVLLMGTALQEFNIAMTLLMGIMAAALSETPSHYKARFHTFILLTFSFFLTISSVQLLSDTPWLFIIGLGLSTFVFVMLSAFGESFRAVGFASLIVAVYTMLGAQSQTITPLAPLWLLAGAALYILYAFIWQIFLTHFSLRQQLATLFYALSYYQREKSRLYDVDDARLDQVRFKLAKKNRSIVSALEECRTLLLLDKRRFAGDAQYRYWYHLYMIAQRLHESSASSHLSNMEKRRQLLNTPVAPLIRKMLLQLAIESRNLAHALEKNHFFTPNSELEEQLLELNTELMKLDQNISDDNRTPISLSSLGKNFSQMVSIYRKGIFAATPDKFTISKIDRLSISQQIKTQLTLKSGLLRHAVRLATCLCSGYLVARLFFDSHGFWILLTSLMLCRQDFASSIRRLGSRFTGTLTGVLTLGFILPLLDNPWGLVILPSVCITGFFLFLRHQYAIAVFFVTWLAGMFFHLEQITQGDYSYFRLVETLVGAVITITVLLLMWPDWKTRRIDLLADHALAQLKSYLNAIAEQFDQPSNDSDTNPSLENRDYRFARRSAHTAEARLLDTLSSIQLEPKQSKTQSRALHEFTMAYHQILSYSSAIATHRQGVVTQGKLSPVISTVTLLLSIYQDFLLEKSEQLPTNEQFTQLHQQLTQLLTQLKGSSLLVCYQLQQIAVVLEKMASHIEKFRAE